MSSEAFKKVWSSAVEELCGFEIVWPSAVDEQPGFGKSVVI